MDRFRPGDLPVLPPDPGVRSAPMRMVEAFIRGVLEGWRGTTQSSQDRWDRKWLQMAALVATWSKDRGTKVGCVVVGPYQEVRSLGYNGFPRGADDGHAPWHERPLKYLTTEHGERNAIFNAARIGTSLEGCTLYLATSPTRLGPCADCGRAIAQAGIRRVVQEGPLSERADWAQSCGVARQHLANAGVEYVVVPPQA